MWWPSFIVRCDRARRAELGDGYGGRDQSACAEDHPGGGVGYGSDEAERATPDGNLPFWRYSIGRNSRRVRLFSSRTSRRRPPIYIDASDGGPKYYSTMGSQSRSRRHRCHGRAGGWLLNSHTVREQGRRQIAGSYEQKKVSATTGTLVFTPVKSKRLKHGTAQIEEDNYTLEQGGKVRGSFPQK